jgi:xanthine dehydrogenase/oxidase
MAFGSMASRSTLVPPIPSGVVGSHWTTDLLSLISDHLDSSLPMKPDTPGGMPEYRRAAARSIAFKFMLETLVAEYGEQAIPSQFLSALNQFEPALTSSVQEYEVKPYVETEPVGRSVQHMSAVKQVSGEAEFLDDLVPSQGELHGALVTSTHAHAQINEIDSAPALALPGVYAVYTARDIPGSSHPIHGSEEVLASREVLYYGHPVALVLASTHLIAVRAASLVRVSYTALPAILTLQDAISSSSFLSQPFTLTRRPAAAATTTSGSDHLGSSNLIAFEGEVYTSSQAHFYLETQCSIASVQEGEVTVHTSTQNPTETQSSVAAALGIKQHRVDVRVKRVGGGFGGKETRSIPVSVLAAVGAWRSGKRVRIVVDRTKDAEITGIRHPFVVRWRAEASADGKIQKANFILFSNGGCSLDLSVPVLHRALFHIDNTYYIPDIEVTGQVCFTHSASNTAFRGFGAPQGMMAIESVLERISAHLSLDPVLVSRPLNFYREGQLTHYGSRLVGCNTQKTWDELVSFSEFVKRRDDVARFNSLNRFKKRGIACVPVKFGLSFTHTPLNQAAALVQVYVDGSVLVAHGGVEIGQGIHTKMCALAAQALRVPLSLVTVRETATSTAANTSATAASMQADLNGMAVLNACRQIRDRLDSFVAADSANRSQMKWNELIPAAYTAKVDLCAHGFYVSQFGFNWSTKQGDAFAYYVYGAGCSEVEIDTLTGEHQVVRSDLVMDLGESLNPALDIGQIEGAYVQGVGWSTLEEVVHEGSSGRVLSTGPGTYKVPGAADTPRVFRVKLIRAGTGNPFGVHSSKGVGEPPFILGASVYFAIKNAVGEARRESGIVGHFELGHPASCDRIRMACRDWFTPKVLPASHPPPVYWAAIEYPTPPDILVPLKQ